MSRCAIPAPKTGCGKSAAPARSSTPEAPCRFAIGFARPAASCGEVGEVSEVSGFSTSFYSLFPILSGMAKRSARVEGSKKITDFTDWTDWQTALSRSLFGLSMAAGAHRCARCAAEKFCCYWPKSALLHSAVVERGSGVVSSRPASWCAKHERADALSYSR